MSDPNELTEDELAVLPAHERAWVERISAWETQDAEREANEVPVVFSREMAEAVQAALQAALQVAYREENQRHVAGMRLQLERAYDLLTAAMRAMEVKREHG